MHYHWALDRHVVHLNHGSFGATPRVVLDAQRRWRDLLEENPTGFFEDRYHDALDEARVALAEFVGEDPEALAFVPNATSGVASVVNGLELATGDEILVTNHAYNACRNTVAVAAARAGAEVVTAPIPFPGTTPDAAVEAVLSRVTARTKLVLVDHVTSPTALVLPVEPIVTALEPDVPVLVDGAHAPGMVPLDLRALGASYYAGNLHKWVCAPKGAGFLAVAARHRDSVRPTVISHGWNRPRGDASMFHRLFDWTGTFDPTAWLSVPAALELMAGLHVDGWPGVMAANRRLALEARDLLVGRIGVAVPAPDDMIGSMAAIPLGGPRPDLALRLRAAGIVAIVFPWPGPDHAVLRVSAQRYNTLDEYERLAATILAE
ncbi:MAG TPA: aminotransferase class V-fold PLP-dependent enzyme [Acidimicrobiia bacterium]|nr:aminotransferase class V-fold PLP-dependent enzyme [Acidimicrobiia bacterium]